MSVAEQQMHARRRARVDIPTVQMDFAEVWKETPMTPKLKRRA